MISIGIITTYPKWAEHKVLVLAGDHASERVDLTKSVHPAALLSFGQSCKVIPLDLLLWQLPSEHLEGILRSNT